MQFRIAMMFSVTSLTGAFSGLLAFGIENLDGRRGIASWHGFLFWSVVRSFIDYLLYIAMRLTQEGAFTSSFGLATFFFVPSSPRNIRFLTEEEHEAYCQDLTDNWSGDADTDGKLMRYSAGAKLQVFSQMRLIFL
jgi:hypothetical protein